MRWGSWDLHTFFQHCQKHPLLSVIPKSIAFLKKYICLKNRLLGGQKTYKSQPLKIFQVHLMVDIRFAKKKEIKSLMVWDLKRSCTVA